MILDDFSLLFYLNLVYDVLYSFWLNYIQFKEFKILWGPGAGGWITQRPSRNCNLSLIFLNTIILEAAT